MLLKNIMVVGMAIFLIAITGCSAEVIEDLNPKNSDANLADTIPELELVSTNSANEETECQASQISAQYFIESPSVGLNDVGSMAIVEFLRDYLSVYSLGEFNGVHLGTYSCLIEWDVVNDHPLILAERPLVVHKWNSDEMPRSFFYNRDNERFENVVFLHWPAWVAVSFSLFDIGQYNYPVIAIHWNVLHTCANNFELFKFINDGFQSVGFLNGRSWQLFNDCEGRLVVLFDSDLYEHYEYAFVIFAEDGLLLDEIVSVRRLSRECEDFSEWYAHHRTYSFTEYPTIFRTNLSLIPVQPLTDLQDEILAYLRDIS